jgi:hypothetical protein
MQRGIKAKKVWCNVKEQSKAKQKGTRQNNKTWGNNKAQSETTRHETKQQGTK